MSEAEKEIQQLKEQITTLSKALAEEMASNFTLSHKVQELKEKLEEQS